MTAGGEENDVPTLQNAALDVALVVVVEINAQASALDEQDLLRELNVSAYRIVDVRVDDLAGGVPHVRELLRQVVGGEKVNSRLIEVA